MFVKEFSKPDFSDIHDIDISYSDDDNEYNIVYGTNFIGYSPNVRMNDVITLAADDETVYQNTNLTYEIPESSKPILSISDGGTNPKVYFNAMTINWDRDDKILVKFKEEVYTFTRVLGVRNRWAAHIPDIGVNELYIDANNSDKSLRIVTPASISVSENVYLEIISIILGANPV